MTGEKLKNVLFINKIEQKTLAAQIGLSPQSFSQMLTATDIKTGLLENICAALGKDMSFFYPECAKREVLSQASSYAPNSGVIGNGSMTQVESTTVSGLLEQLKAKDEQIDKLINLLANK